jgi:hypothetical protein
VRALPIIHQLSADGVPDGWVTYQLAIELGADAANLYGISGSDANKMTLPPAYQEPAPFGGAS